MKLLHKCQSEIVPKDGIIKTHTVRAFWEKILFRYLSKQLQVTEFTLWANRIQWALRLWPIHCCEHSRWTHAIIIHYFLYVPQVRKSSLHSKGLQWSFRLWSLHSCEHSRCVERIPYLLKWQWLSFSACGSPVELLAPLHLAGHEQVWQSHVWKVERV